MRMVATWGSSLLGLAPFELNIGNPIRGLLDLWQSASSSFLEQNWMRLFRWRDLSILMSSGWGRVQRALHLLLTEPAFKRLVIMVVLDEAIWSAIMNNPSVQNFQEWLYSDGTESPQIREEEIVRVTNSLQWLLDILKDKIMVHVSKFKLLLNGTFRPPQPATPAAAAELDEQVRSSLLLSVLIILVIVLARLRDASRSICLSFLRRFMT
ncbi:hypothetical protein ACJRO7_018949 [Eucalyptus globulus]|uniref:Uncharacterized protein n=1 Tax=Eucalyptus globulus TaxID=34317 RepID=A0ABD3KWG4_EUCGL